MFSLWSTALQYVQFIGIGLGFGGEMLLLITYMLAVRDNQISTHEEGVGRVIKSVIASALFLIVVSGICITYMHTRGGQGGIVFVPAYLAKWMLIGIALAISLFHRKMSVPSGILEGVAGGTWFALLALHMLAPMTTWSILLLSFLIWMVGFMTLWSLGLFSVFGSNVLFTARKHTEEVPPAALALPSPVVVPAVVSVPAPQPLPQSVPPAAPPKKERVLTIPTPPEPKIPLTVQPLVYTSFDDEPYPYKKPVIDPIAILHPHLTEAQQSKANTQVQDGTDKLSFAHAEVLEHLPAVRVMPRSQADLDTQHRGPIVKFG